MAYRRLVTSTDSQPREEATPIHMVCMTAALLFPPPDDNDEMMKQCLQRNNETSWPSGSSTLELYADQTLKGG